MSQQRREDRPCTSHAPRGSPAGWWPQTLCQRITSLCSPSGLFFLTSDWFAAFRAEAPRGDRRPGAPLNYPPAPSLPSSRDSIDPCRMLRPPSVAGRKGTMAKEICISSTPHETRLAILEDDQLAEIYYERENEYTLAGSIYNGRVTRVLPGMQSAFVDIGLERDAFLYVTDFIELEDQEETDELEKAAASGAGQAPREVRHPHMADRNGGHQEERGLRSGQKSEARQEVRQERRPAEEAATETTVSFASDSPAAAGQIEAPQEPGETGARRWRGRRRRRGGRGPGAPAGAQTESEPVAVTPPATRVEPPARTDFAHRVRRPSLRLLHRRRAGITLQPPLCFPANRFRSMVARPALQTPKSAAEPAAPPRPAYTSKPSTLIDAPIEWDGSGLLPGESLSLHRRRPEPPVEDSPEPLSDFSHGAWQRPSAGRRIAEEIPGVRASVTTRNRDSSAFRSPSRI